MSKIIEFPTPDRISLNRIIQQVREELEQRNEGEELIEHICKRVTDLHSRYHSLGDYQFDLTLPDTMSDDEAQLVVKQVTEGISNINQISAQAVTELVSEIIRLEIELFNT